MANQIVDLKKEYEVVAFWYDPNIQPKKEYDKRLKAFIKVCKIEDIEWIEGEGENYQVKFEDIDDPQSASQLSSKELFMSKQEIAEVIIPASTQLPIDHTDLNGYEIHDLTTGIRVVIEEVIEMPSQLMAQVSLNQKPYLIPLVPTLIEKIDDITNEIEIHLPHGIFEL